MRHLHLERQAVRLCALMLLPALLLFAGCSAGAGASGTAGASSAPVSEPAGSTPGSGTPNSSAPAEIGGADTGSQPGGIGQSPAAQAAGKPEELAAYRAVLQGEAELLLVGETAEAGSFAAEPVPVDRIPHIFSPYSDYTQFGQFSVLDLDGDGTQEVVVQSIDVAGDMGGYLVLHRQEDEVYGFLFDWRSFWSLKTDGSFEYSSPTGLAWAVGRVQFGPGSCDYALPMYTGATDYTYEEIEYTVNGQPAGEEEYNAAVEAQNAKPDAVWYEFSEEGFGQAFGG